MLQRPQVVSLIPQPTPRGMRTLPIYGMKSLEKLSGPCQRISSFRTLFLPLRHQPQGLTRMSLRSWWGSRRKPGCTTTLWAIAIIVPLSWSLIHVDDPCWSRSRLSSNVARICDSLTVMPPHFKIMRIGKLNPTCASMTTHLCNIIQMRIVQAFRTSGSWESLNLYRMTTHSMMIRLISNALAVRLETRLVRFVPMRRHMLLPSSALISSPSSFFRDTPVFLCGIGRGLLWRKRLILRKTLWSSPNSSGDTNTCLPPNEAPTRRSHKFCLRNMQKICRPTPMHSLYLGRMTIHVSILSRSLAIEIERLSYQRRSTWAQDLPLDGQHELLKRSACGQGRSCFWKTLGELWVRDFFQNTKFMEN